METFSYPTHPVRCIVIGTSECGKSVFVTNLILNINNDHDKNKHLLSISTPRFISKIS